MKVFRFNSDFHTKVKSQVLWLIGLCICNLVLCEEQLITRTFCSTNQGQIYCSSGLKRDYPLERIEAFTDDNKALVERLYGGFSSEYRFSGGFKRKRNINSKEIDNPIIINPYVAATRLR